MEKIEEKLFELQDKKYKDFHRKICNNSKLEIIGVRVPELRRLAQQIIAENEFKDFLENEDIKYYEQALLKGLVIGMAKMPFEETCSYLKKFIPIIDNWAVCDITCSSLKVTKKNMEKMWKFLYTYTKSNKEYELRFCIVMYLSYYIKKEYLNKIFNIIEYIKNDEYYTKMAIAWFISIAYIKQPEETIEFLKQTKIDNWTYNKALQKIIESYRVTPEDKELIKNMKKI